MRLSLEEQPTEGTVPMSIYRPETDHVCTVSTTVVLALASLFLGLLVLAFVCQ